MTLDVVHLLKLISLINKHEEKEGRKKGEEYTCS